MRSTSVGHLRLRRRAEGEERVLLANFATSLPLEDVDLPAERSLSSPGALGQRSAGAEVAAIFGTQGGGPL